MSQTLLAAESPAMFIETPVWFSEEPKEGLATTIETALFNSATKTLSGTVSFYDNDTLLGKTNVVIPSRSVRIASINWKVTSGDHRIRAELSQGKLGDGANAVSLASISTDTVRKNVTHAISVAPPRPDREGTPEGKQLEVVDNLQEKVTELLPENIKEAFATVDEYRQVKAESAAVWKANTQEKIDAQKSGESNVKSATSNKVEKSGAETFSPFTYVELFLASIGTFVLGNSLIAYGLVIIIFLLMMRVILNKISG